jgi:putative ABC transport system permease protein
MFKNYLKTAVRNLWRTKTFSFINVVGLAVGMAVSFLILLLVFNELTYDRFHENSENIYRIATKIDAEGRKLHVPNVPAPFGLKLKELYPEIAAVARLRGSSTRTVSIDDKLFEENKVYYADPGLFKVFTIDLVRGDPRSALEAPFSLVLTEELAEKYFGESDPLGRTLRFLNEEDPYTITGIARRMPENSHFKFTMLGSLSSMEKLRRDLHTWMGFNYYTYLEIQGGHDTATLTQKYYDQLMANLPDQIKKLDIQVEIELQPLTKIHFSSYTEGEMEPPGNPSYIRIFITIALFILVIACINFMNLSTAQSSKRAKEVGMRKVLGAQRGKLVSQFMGESLLLSLLGLLLAVLLILILLPAFNQLIQKALAFSPLANWEVTLGFIAITILAGLLSGAYPALFLSSFVPIEIFHSRLKAGKSHTFFRNGLVSLQYIISISLICSTLVIFSQLRHVKNHDLGFDQEQVVTMGLARKVNPEVFKAELVGQPGIVKVAAADTMPAMGRSETFFTFEQVPEGGRQVLPYIEIDEDYLDTMGMTIVAGRGFSREFPSDKKAMILNETLVKQLGWDDPLGKTVSMTDFDDNQEYILVPYTVIGVVRDFHFESLHQKIRGHIFMLGDDLNMAAIKIRPDNIPQTLAGIEHVWQKMETGRPFDYSFLDETFDRLYRTEQRLGQIFISFTLIAIIIAALGLFGLASFTVNQRVKEIGIRKILGASTPNVVLLLSKEFTKWVILANVVAWPLAYFAMNKWLQNFAYRIDIHIGIFLVSGIAALLVSLLTVSSKAVKAAVANPVDSLRYE